MINSDPFHEGVEFLIRGYSFVLWLCLELKSESRFCFIILLILLLLIIVLFSIGFSWSSWIGFASGSSKVFFLRECKGVWSARYKKRESKNAWNRPIIERKKRNYSKAGKQLTH